MYKGWMITEKRKSNKPDLVQSTSKVYWLEEDARADCDRINESLEVGNFEVTEVLIEVNHGKINL